MDFANLKIIAKGNITTKIARTYLTARKFKLVTRDTQNITKDLTLENADSKTSVHTITKMFLKQMVNVNTQKKLKF